MTTKNKADGNEIEENKNSNVPSSVVPGCVSLPLPGPFSNLSAIWDVKSRSLEVKFSSSIKNSWKEQRAECRIHIQILDMVSKQATIIIDHNALTTYLRVLYSYHINL